MPTINIKQYVYDDLHKIMANELNEKFNSTNSKEVMLDIVKNKYGTTFSTVIAMMVKQYKKDNKIEWLGDWVIWWLRLWFINNGGLISKNETDFF